MEYRIEKLLEGLEKHRANLVESLCVLNESTPNYPIKVVDLNNQIVTIDNQINNLILSLKDLKVIELQNELTIKTSK